MGQVTSARLVAIISLIIFPPLKGAMRRLSRKGSPMHGSCFQVGWSCGRNFGENGAEEHKAVGQVGPTSRKSEIELERLGL